MKYLLLIGIIMLLISPVFAARKALVVGNATYEQGTLKNPLNDATDVAKALTELGFGVSLHKDLNRAGFYKAVGDFVSALTLSDEAVFFYSGHAVQIEGTNYLVPVNEFIDSETRCAFLSYNCTMLMEELKRAAVSIVFLDACRDNPFNFNRSLGKGLASMKAAGGTQLIVFATEEGNTAEDGEGRNSPFTASLLANINTQDKKITDLIQTISNDVAIKTQERQIPSSTGVLRQDFYFTKASATPYVVATRQKDTPVQISTNVEEHKATVGSGMGSIKIQSKFGGDLYLDGDFNQSLFSGASATWTEIPVGTHTVELKNPREQLSRKVNVIKNQLSLIDFDAPDTFAELKPDEPAQAKAQAIKPARELTPARPPLAPIRNEVSSGSGTVDVLSPIDADIYLGGVNIGNVSANKAKKFSKQPAGLHTLELLGKFACYREELTISDKGTAKVVVPQADIVPYLRELIYLPSGEYFRGTQFVDRNEYERPRHEVVLPAALMSFTEVTQKLWNSVMSENPSARTGDNFPVTNINWYQAVEFCNALSTLDGLEPCYKIDKDFPDASNVSDYDTLRYSVSCNWEASGYRLPTEAEWEYAAKCGDSSKNLQFSGSNNSDEVAWYDKNSNNRVREVGTLSPNEWGFFDLSGNVAEWCWDYWGPYIKDKQTHPKGSVSGSYRVARGGSWMSAKDNCTVTYRGGFSPQSQSNELGFRIVRNARAN